MKENHGEAKGRDIRDNKTKTLVKSQPAQLNLFQTFLPQDDKYSNTIELYDAIPKYFANKRQMVELREGPEGREIYLPTLEREFKHKDILYTVTITPARVKDRKDKEAEYYPSVQEELVEEALRKLACDRLNGVYIGPLAGVQFTMHELREELRIHGHSMALDELKRSLLICTGTRLYVEKKGGEGEVLLNSSIFPTVMISNRKDWRADPRNTYCYVQFNPLVTASIEAMTYRQFDYETLMSYEKQLSRWLHKTLYHNYVNASLLNNYNYLLSSVKRNSGLLNNQRISQDIKYLEETLEELEKKGVLWGFDKEERRGKYNRIDDVLYKLKPSVHFTNEMKSANVRINEVQKKSPIRLPGHSRL